MTALGHEDIMHYMLTRKLNITNINENTIRENGIDCRIGKTIAIDIKLDDDFIVDTHDIESVTKRFDMHNFNESGEIIPAKNNILLVTEEEFSLPDDVMGLCCLRSTIARQGFVCPITIIDAGFQGTLTIETFYGGNNKIKIYKGDRFLHVVFIKINSPVAKPYNGIYKGQTVVRLPKCMD